MPRNSRFRRRPNNSGTVVKLSGKRRNPFCARVMSDERDIITGKKKQICIVLNRNFSTLPNRKLY